MSKKKNKNMALILLSSVIMVISIVELAAASSPPHASSGPHIADVNLLLPPKMTFPVEYRLQGSDGCFKWSWDHHDILSVLPEYNSSNKCSTSARLRSIAPYSGRKETAVYATDVKTGIVIRCKVFIDNISRIQIFHNSIKLDLDGLATLHVRAFDSEENVFSSLAGLQFMWSLMPEANGLPYRLVNVPIKDSPLSDCGGLCGDLDIQIKLEDDGVFSDLFVVKGIEIGHEIVSVHLLEPQLQNMADEILLTVAEAMSLEPPSPVFVLVGAVVPYTLKVIRGNIPQVVTLPSPHHQWSASNDSVAQVDSKTGLAYAWNLGMTAITVEDTRVAAHVQVSSLNVVLPAYLGLYITPLSSSGDPVEGIKSIPLMARWYVVSGRQYLIQIKVFAHAHDEQEIYITENDDVNVYDYRSDCWRTVPVSNDIAFKHGWRNTKLLKAYSQGHGNLTASVSYPGGADDKKEIITVAQEVMVCDQVKFTLGNEGGVILLPWAPGVHQDAKLKAVGGCAKAVSDYKWLSSDISTVSVSASGTIQAKKPGKATIKVISVYDSLNYDEVLVEVSIPSSMVMLHNFHVETVIGSRLQAAVTMKTSNGAFFYRCDAFNSLIKWKAGSESFVVVNASQESSYLETLPNSQVHPSDEGFPCSWTHIYASNTGQAIIRATLSLEYHQFSHAPVVLKASLRIAAYLPFIVRQAGDGNHFGGYWLDLAQAENNKQLHSLEELDLVPGTNLDLLLVGGPEPWNKHVDFIESVDVLGGENDLSDGVLVHQISDNSRTLYRVLCQRLGTFKLLFKRGNLVGDDHRLPSVAEALLPVICSIPSSIVLIADEPVNEYEIIRASAQAERSSRRLRDNPITVANGRTIRISAAGISASGEAFANSSSLSLKWELGSCEGLAYWDYAFNIVKSSDWERFLVLQNESGLCIVRATVTGFLDGLGDGTFHQFSQTENVLTDAIRLQLVSMLRVDPEFSLIYFNPNAKVNLSITGGSCFLEAVTNDSQVVEVTQPTTGLECHQLSLSPKGLGIANLTLYDMGLTPPLRASALVQVADIEWIQIMSGEEISLMEGSLQTIDLLAGTNGGNNFHASQFVYMNLHVHVEDTIIELLDTDSLSSHVGRHVNAPSFKIKGRYLGITTLYVSAMQHSGHVVQSQAIRVEVYKAPRIHPHEIFLLPGASYVLTVEGGPSLGVHVEYAVENDKIASIDRYTGRLLAISTGNTTIIASVFVNGNTVICEARSVLKVGVSSTIKLHMQSEQLGVGCKLPIYPLFPEGNLFSFYELCKSYQWTIEDEQVLSFKVAESLHGEKYGTASEDSQVGGYFDENDIGFINVLYGRSAGKTKVALSFSCEFSTSGSKTQSRLYSSSLSVTVVPDLPLALGLPITWILPPYYTTTSLLPSSSESYYDGQNHKGTIKYSLLSSIDKNALQNDAVFIDGDKIKTSESNNLACIQAKDRTTGRIEIASCVKVSEVTQVRIASKEVLFKVIDLAVGAEFDLPTTFYDTLGNPFYEAYNAVRVYAETNYPDVLAINKTADGKGNIHIKAIRHGKALVRVAISEAQQKSDYVLIRVGAHVYPRNPVLHIGSPLNLSIRGLNDKVSGQWVTTNESVISVDALSGVAKAIGEGSAQVYFHYERSKKLQTTITVLKGHSISVDAPKGMLTNVPYPTKGYNFSVKFSTTYGESLDAPGGNKIISFDCRVDPPYVGYVEPWLDLDTGNSYCVFFPYSPEHLVHSIPKSEGTRPDVSVSIYASLKEHEHVLGSASALFIGGFSIMEMGKDPMQLSLTPDSNKTYITIVGNTDVEIHWNRRDLIMIVPISKDDFGVRGFARYEVKLLKGERFKDKIIITLPTNGQRMEIGITHEPEPDEKALSNVAINKTLWAKILGCLLLLILSISAFICFLDKPDRSQETSAPITATIASPATPYRSSPPVTNEMSPRTPQPFVDYVRRTIDETPYYKREGRRVNPQNTF
ncbi:nuclear pore complex protein GP210 isoform X2 [Trifolium pratense]|uniref:nuclear pore complex protein GP210 isoform X2 n=1 Tax=Trifolium pratense TaxID=57577 RepID=UPI001E69013A|nr:nuclear pore complex protein GP210 isoform X2 [Trifolium pratense]